MDDIINYINSNISSLYEKLDQEEFSDQDLDDTFKSIITVIKEKMEKYNIKKFTYITEEIKIDNLVLFEKKWKNDFIKKRKKFLNIIPVKILIQLSEELKSKIIFQFIEKYDGKYSETDIQNLKTILNRNKFDYDGYELCDILSYAKEYMKNKATSSLFEKIDANTVDEYLYEVISHFGENYSKYRKYITYNLNEKYKENLDYVIIENKCKVIIDKINLMYFEKAMETIDNSYDNINGYEFEIYLSDLFKRKNYKTIVTKKSNDQGADIILEKLGRRIVIQAKLYNSTVGNKAIQEVLAAKSHYKGDIGVVITSNYFTKAAIELAESNNIILIDKLKLDKAILEPLYDPIFSSLKT